MKKAPWKNNISNKRAVWNPRTSINKEYLIMGKKHLRRQVGGLTADGRRITIGHVSSNGGAVKNARAKGCFGGPGRKKRG
jgi:hypothetical protein